MDSGINNVRFDELRRTPLLDVITVLSSMGVFMDGFALSIFSIALPYMENIFLTRAYFVSLAAAGIYIGMFAGSLVIGRLSDSIGRRKMYVYDLLITTVFLLLTAFSTNVWEFFIFELLAGIGIGADYPLSSSIQAEFSPKKSRGSFLVFNIFMWTIGSMVFYLISIPIVLYSGSFAWRLMYIVGALVPISVIIVRRILPESPYYLVKSGNVDEAKKVANEIGQEAGVNDVEPPHVDPGKTNFSDVFTGRYLPLIIFVSLAWFSYDVSSYGVWNYTPSIFISVGASYVSTVVETLLEEIPVVIGFIVCLIFIERIGRKFLETAGFGLAGVSLLFFALLSMHHALPFIFVFMAFAMMHFFHNMGPTNITYVYPVEIFPTRIRGTAMGIATAASRIGAILGVVAFPIITDMLNKSYGLSYGLLFFAIFEFIGFFVTLFLAPETKGKPLA